MSSQRMQIKNLKNVLKEFEPMVKNADLLRNGRRIQNFNLLPREAWGNWLLCAALRHHFSRDITFAEDDEVDGIIYDRDEEQWFPTEHVSSLNVPAPHNDLRGEERVLQAIQHKIDYGEEYARGKRLVVFLENAEWWYPNRVGRAIHGHHHFDAIYVISLFEGSENGYIYSLSQLDGIEGHSPTWRIEINADFSDWTVVRIQ